MVEEKKPEIIEIPPQLRGRIKKETREAVICPKCKQTELEDIYGTGHKECSNCGYKK